jgi:hypothetical protein
LVPLPATGAAHRLRSSARDPNSPPVDNSGAQAAAWLSADGRYVVPPAQRYVVAQIERVSGGLVTVRTVLDRNRIPLDPVLAPSHVVDVRKLLPKPAAAAAAAAADEAKTRELYGPYGDCDDVKLLNDEEVVSAVDLLSSCRPIAVAVH